MSCTPIANTQVAILIQQFDSLSSLVKEYVASQHSHATGEYEFDFHLYGKPDENTPITQSSEIFLIGEALASSQELATSVAATARIGIIVSLRGYNELVSFLMC